MNDLENAEYQAHIIQQKINKAHYHIVNSCPHLECDQTLYYQKQVQDLNRQNKEMKNQIMDFKKREAKVLSLFDVDDFKTAFKLIKDLKDECDNIRFKDNHKLKNLDKQRAEIVMNDPVMYKMKINDLKEKSIQLININESIKKELDSLRSENKSLREVNNNYKIVKEQNSFMKSEIEKIKEQNKEIKKKFDEVKQENIKINGRKKEMKIRIQQLNNNYQIKYKALKQHETELNNELFKEKEKRRILNQLSLNLIHLFIVKIKDFTEKFELKSKKLLIKVKAMISQVNVEKLHLTIPNYFFIEQFQQLVSHIWNDFGSEKQPKLIDFVNSPDIFSDVIHNVINLYSNGIKSSKIK